MAIKKTVITVHGFVAEDAYHRVDAIRLVGKDKIAFNLNSYNVSPQTNPNLFDSKPYTCGYDATSTDNLFEQAYNYLKTLPEWEDAEDC
jgi:hypothetical protein